MKNKKYNKTHEECEDCAYVCDDNSPCDGHPSGLLVVIFSKKEKMKIATIGLKKIFKLIYLEIWQQKFLIKI